MSSLIRVWLVGALLWAGLVSAGDLRFDGSISEPVLRSYLARSMTTMYLLSGQGDFDDNVRMLTNTGVKFAGRAVYNWGREQGGESKIPARLEQARVNAAKIHAADPDLILQGCVFEIVTDDVDRLAVPPWVFEELGLPVETRNFRYEAMAFPDGGGRNQRGKNSCVPDVTEAETQLWFHYLACVFIDLGCEAIHFGQAEMVGRSDKGWGNWDKVLTRVRDHANRKARRHLVLCDAHVPRGGLVKDGRLLLDFHTFPLRIEEVADRPKEARLRVGYTDAIYGRSKGGITPSGWSCEHLPYLVEFDNYGRSKKPGEAAMGPYWVWGWDEITWFSQLPEAARNDWLRYAWAWVRKNDSAGYVQMPGMRCLAGAADGKRFYYVNRTGARVPDGSGQEETIMEIWKTDSGVTSR
jgi:hypothetical protein